LHTGAAAVPGSMERSRADWPPVGRASPYSCGSNIETSAADLSSSSASEAAAIDMRIVTWSSGSMGFAPSSDRSSSMAWIAAASCGGAPVTSPSYSST
jgi:hypothetical protein